jgi:hypothetical protein
MEDLVAERQERLAGEDRSVSDWSSARNGREVTW